MSKILLLVLLGNGQLAAVPYTTQAECQQARAEYAKHEKVVEAKCYSSVGDYIYFNL